MEDWNVAKVIKINTPLAMHLAYDWLQKNKIGNISEISSYVINEQLETVKRKLQNFQFPGRFQYLKVKNLK